MSLRAGRFPLALLLATCLTSIAIGQTQPRAAYLDRPSRVVLPGGFDPERAYPVLVFLPFTGGSAERLYERIAPGLDEREAIVLLPPGTPSREEYLPDFISYIGWYEERLLEDLALLRSEYRVDEQRVAMAGFSLGGDLAWALSLRNPELFRGAVMAGTRTSYPASSEALQTLRTRDFKAAFVIGEFELDARYQGIRQAERATRDAGLRVRFRTVRGGAHTYGDPEEFARDLRWLIRPSATPPTGR